jgi:hypothetical protein
MTDIEQHLSDAIYVIKLFEELAADGSVTSPLCQRGSIAQFMYQDLRR